MTIGDFLEYCMDAAMLKVEIYSIDSSNVEWFGDGDDVPDHLLDTPLWSYDVPTREGILTLNIY